MPASSVPIETLSKLRFTPVAGAERLVELHAAELPQKNQLCGAFWGTLALRAAGIRQTPGPIDQDTVACAAGSVLSGASSDGLPPGEPGRADYRLLFPIVEDPACSGTSVGGLIRALRELSSGQLEVVPVAGPWSAEAVGLVLDAASACRQPCTPIANVATGRLWGTRPSPASLLAYLNSGNADGGPVSDWDVGHFLGLLGRIEGARATLAIVADTYRSLGWQGIHVQPLERLADALAPTGSERASGVLLVTAADEAAKLGRRLRSAGLDIRPWDNGSLDATSAR